jgi:D-lactate dehydrogenase (cytochrome)
MPAVPKCSAGYFAEPHMDLIDLFVGCEGTLGIVIDATLKILPATPAVAMALVSVAGQSAALALVDDLRRASHDTWRTHDAHGLDVAAIESLDRRCLDFLHEDGADRTCDVTMHAGTAMMLLIQIELPAGTTSATTFEQIGTWTQSDAPDTAMARLCRLLDRHGVLDRTEMAMPDDARRKTQFLAFREAAPMGVNRRIAESKRTIDPRMEKTAADMIVPFEALGEMLHVYQDGYRRRGLDFAIWGHVSDGNLHPNVLPRSYDDIVAGKEAILEFGREAVRLGGCPLAEHGVGRSVMKQTLLRQLYGDAGIDDMRAIKRALDPDWKLAPGVLFSEGRA